MKHKALCVVLNKQSHIGLQPEFHLVCTAHHLLFHWEIQFAQTWELEIENSTTQRLSSRACRRCEH